MRFEERLLVERAGQRDVEAFAILVEKYANAVYATVLSKVGDFRHARMLTRETFLELWREPEWGTSAAADFGGGLSAIAARVVRSAAGATPLRGVVADEGKEADSTGQRALLQALGRLKEQERRIVAMYLISDFSLKEIGKFAGLSAEETEDCLQCGSETLEPEICATIEETFAKHRLDESFLQSVLDRLDRQVEASDRPK